ncbi:MAG: hypothetical protein K6T68_09530, partial [Alicyclobacillus shizuokensis]|nr:hypothetical protein [Alicyclobacillus shizuokensis]
MTTMLSLEGAFDRMLQLHRPVRSEQVPVAQALGRITTAAITARTSVPPFARAMMDGYAVRAESARRGARLRRVGCVLAGDESAREVHPGEAVRIMTGAPLPPGADSVLRFEWCEDDGEDEVVVLRSIREGESVQPAGDDARAGQVIVPSGTRLSARHLAVCHGFGVSQVSVAVRPTAAIVITGSELVGNPRQPLRAVVTRKFAKGALSVSDVREHATLDHYFRVGWNKEVATERGGGGQSQRMPHYRPYDAVVV